MKTIELTGYVIASQWSWDEKIEFNLSTYESDDCSEHRVSKTLFPVTVTVEVPETVDFTSAAVASLEAQKASIHAEYKAKLSEINARLAKFQALEYHP